MTSRKPSATRSAAQRKNQRKAKKQTSNTSVADAPSKRSIRPPPQRDSSVLGPLLSLLCPWQLKWIQDRSRFKKLKKSRRVGGTWIQALEDVLDAAETSGLDVWFTSADQSSGVEYIKYVRMWAQALPLLIQIADISQVPESDLDGVEFAKPEAVEFADEGVATAMVVRFHNGSRITALTSSPTRLRSKGGKLVIDEFAHHKNDRELWKAGQPVALRGHSVRVLSTPNGKSCLFSKLGTRPQDQGVWSVHEITLTQALSEGMLDQIEGRPTTDAEREEFRKECEASCASHEDYLEEYEGIEQDEAHALLTYEAIRALERDLALGMDQVTGPIYVGMDVARRRDLSVIYVLEECGNVLVLRHRVEMRKTKFSVQKEILWEILEHPRLVRALIDATGIGAQLAEEAQDRFGTYRVEAVTFTAAVKDHLATRLVQEVQDATLQIDDHEGQREGLHAVRRVVSGTNAVRYDAAHDEQNGHADHFWALALAVSGARTGDTGMAEVRSAYRSYVADRFMSGGMPIGLVSGGRGWSSLDAWAGLR